MQTSQKYNCRAIKIFRLWFRLRKLVKTWKKGIRRSKHRFNVLRQWLETEKNYFASLILIKQQIEKPLKERQVLNSEQLTIVFPNLDSITKLSQQLILSLQKIIKNWHPNTLIAATLLECNPYFKIYIVICSRYYVAQRLFLNLKSNKTFQEIQTTFITKYKCGIDSYMIKPIQRLGKYVLFLRDYINHMDQYHKDYEMMQLALEKYKNINEINNESIHKSEIQEKMFHLQKLYENLLDTPRDYIREFEAEISGTNVYIYVFNNLLLITKKGPPQILQKAIELNRNSFISRMDNGKYYKNILFVCGKSTCITLYLPNHNLLQSIEECLIGILEQLQLKEVNKMDRLRKHYSSMLQDQYQIDIKMQELTNLYPSRNGFNLRVSIIGVEVLPHSMVNNEILYVIKFTLPSPAQLSQSLFMDYNILVQLYQKVISTYPNLKFDDTTPSNYEVNYYEQYKNRSQIIEYRMMSLQVLLNALIRAPINLEQIIKSYLPISKYIWGFNSLKCNCRLCQYDEQFILETHLKKRVNKVKLFEKLTVKQYCSNRYIKDQIEVLNLSFKQFDTLEKVLVYLEASEGKINYMQISKPLCQETYIVKVALYNVSKEDLIKVKIDKNTTIDHLLGLVCKQIGIYEYHDFGLFIDYQEIPRLLDGDQNALNIIQKNSIEVEKIEFEFLSSLSYGFNYLKSKGNQLLYSKKSRIYLRKYIFLEPNLEAASAKACPPRLRLLVQQILCLIQKQQILLQNTLTIKIYALFITFREIDKIHHISVKNFPTQLLNCLIPESKKQILKEPKFIEEIVQKIDRLRKTVCLEIDKLMILQEQIVGFAQANWCSKACMFPVAKYVEKTQKTEKTQKALVGVTYKHLFIVNVGEIEPIFIVNLEDLKWRVCAFSIFFDGEEKVRYDGLMLYNLKQIIKKYLIYNQMKREHDHAKNYESENTRLSSQASFRLNI